MNFYLAVTDNDWFKFPSNLTPDDAPMCANQLLATRGNTTFKAIEPGAPFLFKLHSPYNYIAGGGFFVRHSFLPLTLAYMKKV